MQTISFPADAFSHGQIRSKIWLTKKLNMWSQKHMALDKTWVLNWYGSWCNVGPFMLLSNTFLNFIRINLYELTDEYLEVAPKFLDFWRCEGVEINQIVGDVNSIYPNSYAQQLFVNTACEHMVGTQWVENIPHGAFVLFQSTDMVHPEHINRPLDLDDFTKPFLEFVEVLESAQINFDYPDKSFNRYMLFGTKK